MAVPCTTATVFSFHPAASWAQFGAPLLDTPTFQSVSTNTLLHRDRVFTSPFWVGCSCDTPVYQVSTTSADFASLSLYYDSGLHLSLEYSLLTKRHGQWRERHYLPSVNRQVGYCSNEGFFSFFLSLSLAICWRGDQGKWSREENAAGCTVFVVKGLKSSSALCSCELLLVSLVKQVAR